MALKSVTFSL